MTKYKRYANESDEALIFRITGEKDKIGSWQDVADVLNELLGRNYKPDTYRKQRQCFDMMFKANQSKWTDCQEQIKKLDEKIKELEIAKIKLQTEKLEYSSWKREQARDELIFEKIQDAISNIEPLKLPTPLFRHQSKQQKEYVLCFGDEHYGAEFEIKGLFGETINAYSPEIFEKRMWSMLQQTIDVIRKENITHLNVFSMGDFGDGCLRVSQLLHLRHGVIDGTIKYADFICNWLNELSKHVYVTYQQTNGNHTELRMLNQPKGTFKEDNMGKVVSAFVKERMKNNSNFKYVDNPTGYIYAEIAGYNILGIHGEVKSMENTLREMSQIYNTKINYLIAGHLHHNKVEEVGMSYEVINIPSIIGVNPYAISLNKSCDAASKLFVVEQDKGITCEYTFKLNTTDAER